MEGEVTWRHGGIDSIHICMLCVYIYIHIYTVIYIIIICTCKRTLHKYVCVWLFNE